MLYVFDARSLPAEVALLECHEEHPEHLARVETGDALTCVLALLERLTPAQLKVLRDEHIVQVEQTVILRAMQAGYRQRKAKMVRIDLDDEGPRPLTVGG